MSSETAPTMVVPGDPGLPPRLTLTLLCLVLAGMAACGDSPDDAPAPETVQPHFVDITAASRLDSIHKLVLNGEHALPEIMGAGCAVFDAEGDGDLDIYLLNSGDTAGRGAANELWLRGPDGRYTLATDSGLEDTGYGMGVTVGDVDNDGDIDVFVGNWGLDALYLNDGSGRFEDASTRAGLTREEWTTSVALIDFDLDGLLDVYAVHYVAFDPAETCRSAAGRPSYCSPKRFDGRSDALYRNLGAGRFEDVSRRVGIEARALNGLGVVVADFSGDGWPDVFVANDGEDNNLWINDRRGHFVDEAAELGVAVNVHGHPEASMGVALGDADGDGSLDLFMTHLANESSTMYLRGDASVFSDETGQARLQVASLARTGFGTLFVDVENDGDLDIVHVNGRVTETTGAVPHGASGPLAPYAEPDQLLLNEGGGRFADVSAASPDLGHLHVSRGLAAADLDGDGDLDLVVTSCGGPVRILENVAKEQGHWLAVTARDDSLNRELLGALVTVFTAKGSHCAASVSSASYLSGWSIPLHFGLGASERYERIEVTWPGGDKESFPGGAVDRAIDVVKGRGTR